MAYAKNWAEIEERAKDFIVFLQGDNFFSKHYEDDGKHLILRDLAVAMNYTLDDSEDIFSDWEDLFSTQFTEDFSFELSTRIHYNLSKTNYFDFFQKNLNGLLNKWIINNDICIAEEMISIHIQNILDCYANDYFPPIWQEILEVYYDGGLPCGWSGMYPDGKMVVFSNF